MLAVRVAHGNFAARGLRSRWDCYIMNGRSSTMNDELWRQDAFAMIACPRLPSDMESAKDRE